MSISTPSSSNSGVRVSLPFVTGVDRWPFLLLCVNVAIVCVSQAVQGTGLAFIAFTEAMTHFPASPFWSVMFFLMLVNLGLGSMFGTIEGIITPIVDTFKVRKEILTGEFSCIWLFLELIGALLSLGRDWNRKVFIMNVSLLIWISRSSCCGTAGLAASLEF